VGAHKNDWQWWDNPAIQRPLVSMVVVRPGDTLEKARPERGVTLRIRCAWENTPQGLIRTPITELVKVVIDGEEREPILVSQKRPNSPLLTDHYHYVVLPDLAVGPHDATATIREVASKRERSEACRFVI